MRIPRRHILGPDSTFHKIWRCHNREFLLQDHVDKLAYLEAIHDDFIERCKREDFAIHAFCLMSNHVHEKNSIRMDLEAFSRHMQRAHGRFGLRYNKRHGRLGKVAYDRPKTIRIQDDDEDMRCTFYIDCNPVRAGLTKHPTDLLWNEFSSCRFYALGKRNRFADMIDFPDWYMRLGKNWRQRQSKYRSLLDRYLVQEGLKRDPRMTRGYFLGGEPWVLEMGKVLRGLLRQKSEGPPD
jgi:putative transposase